jgi:YYY domain-containing protein
MGLVPTLLRIVTWLLVAALLTVLGAPLAAWLFPTLPRRGAAFGLPVSLAGVALVTFWVGQVTFGVHAVVLAVGAVAALGGLAFRRSGAPDWRAVAGAYGVFALAFLFLASFRAADPGVVPAGGERFLHFGLTKAVARAQALPPGDFWFAGEPVRYYYGSQLQVTGLSLVTGTPLRVGYNLGLATFYGVLAVSAYGLAGAVTRAAGYPYRLGGALGVFFVAVGGALTTAVRLAFGLLPEDLALRYGHAAFEGIRHEPYPEAVRTQSVPGEWTWFYTRYVVPDTLQEFPLYSFVKADLHGHTLSTGYVVLAAALAYSYYRLPAGRRGRRLAVLAGLGCVAGVFGFMNTWSLPTAVGLTALAVAAADAHPATLLPDPLADRLHAFDPADGGLGRLAAELWRLLLAAVPAVAVGAAGVALASPFLVFGRVPRNEGVGFFPPRTDLVPFLIIYGALLALFAGYLALRGWDAARDSPLWARAAAVAVGLGAIAALVTVAAFPVLAAVGPLIAVAWWLVRTDRAGFEAVLLIAGLGLLLSMEVVHARVAPWNQTRWNTTLKVAVQGWTLAGAAAGVTAAVLLGEARTALAPALVRVRGGTPATTDGGAVRRAVPAAMACLLVVAVVGASAPFAALAWGTEVGGKMDSAYPMTLDGFAGHERWKGEQMAAVSWLDDREGTPTLAEAPGEAAYRWSNPMSTLTGLPTVVGWLNHEGQHRGDDAVGPRVGDVDALYTGSWPAAEATLLRYDVRYVVVGPNERERYGDDLRDFGERDGLSVAFENEAVTIYEVDRSAL